MNPLSINNSMVDKPIRYKIEKCFACDGSGKQTVHSDDGECEVPCATCDGTGEQEVKE